ncbi:MAG: response regulator transcription factor, partial [Cyclobacteriaceae bacterium]|nr:response regulator transcription factor [Cyclobacteriaceae bacterium]
IIILTMYPQQSFTEEIIKIGIDGCLLKNNSGQELGAAIHRVMAGKQYYDLIHNFNSSKEEVVQHKLSKRELDIIRLLAEGLTSPEIGEKLFISEHTVRTHRKNILRKMDFTNTSQLVQYATTNQLI